MECCECVRRHYGDNRPDRRIDGPVTLRASRHQVPATVYVMAAQPPMATPGAGPVSPGAGPVPGGSEPKATSADPAQAHGTGENNQAP